MESWAGVILRLCTELLDQLVAAVGRSDDPPQPRAEPPGELRRALDAVRDQLCMRRGGSGGLA